MFASLPCPLATATTTIPAALTSSSKASSRRRLPASCNATPNGDSNQNNPSNISKLDRRNLLVGLGGLYGAAANLGSNKPASAAPIPPPDFLTCRTPTEQFSHEVLEYVNCCPPLPCDGKIIDYELPPVTTKRFRPAAHQITPQYLSKYKEAVQRMKNLPLNDPRNFWQQANIHCAYCNEAYQYPFPDESTKKTIQVHACWLFFPFHRWYLYFYERILGSLIGDPNFGLPFWHWDSPRSMGMTVPPMYLDPESPLFDEHRDKKHMKSLVTLSMSDMDHQLTPKQIIADNMKVMHDEMIRNAHDILRFMGKKYSKGDEMNPGEGTIERGCHTAVHAFVGDRNMPNREDLGNFYSAGRDSIFFAHHANLDRLWSVWKALRRPGQPKDITDPDYLNVEFLFYDEKQQLVRVKVHECLNQERMGYFYQKVDNPWIRHRSPIRPQKSTAVATSNAPKLEEVVFPVKLDKIVKIVVPRASDRKKSGDRGEYDLQAQEEEEEEEEVLLIEGIECDKGKYTKFDVFVNDEDDDVYTIDRAEYAGTFSQLAHRHEGGERKMKTSITLSLTDLFKDVLVEDDDEAIVVSLVPKAGDVTIGGIKMAKSCSILV